MIAPGENDSLEAHAAYNAYLEKTAKENSEKKAAEAKERAKKAIQAASMKAQMEEERSS